MPGEKNTVSGNIVDIFNSKIYAGTITITSGRITGITRDDKTYETFIIPGFVDAHVHIESSMLVPSEFARAAVVHGTVAVVSDPHEIANVLGVDGVKYMIENGKTVPMKFFFGAPSCVPATTFETSGAVLDSAQVEELLQLDEVKFMGEVMNFPGVLHGDEEVIKKINAAKKYGKLIDGHAPGLQGKDLATYAGAGITTNHECLSRDEVLENIRSGMKVLIRKGSAADIFEECLPILDECYESCMFCSDDKHPDDLMKGYLNDMVRQAIRYGVDVMKVIRVASVNPVIHYDLDVGLLRVGDSADFLEVENLDNITILNTYINGQIVAKDGTSLIPHKRPTIINTFRAEKKNVSQFAVPYRGGNINVIEALDGQLVTEHAVKTPRVKNGLAVADVERDLLKIAVVNRYDNVDPAVGFISNFGLREGAIASSVAHDSHNIVAVGVDDDALCQAVNVIIEKQGGICAVSRDQVKILPLPVAGIMSDEECGRVAMQYTEIDSMAKSMGSKLRAPFMTLSFMSLPVIPKLKITDKGLFDGEQFAFVNVFADS